MTCVHSNNNPYNNPYKYPSPKSPLTGRDKTIPLDSGDESDMFRDVPYSAPFEGSPGSSSNPSDSGKSDLFERVSYGDDSGDESDMFRDVPYSAPFEGSPGSSSNPSDSGDESDMFGDSPTSSLSEVFTKTVLIKWNSCSLK